MLSADDRRLLRDVLTWARAEGWRPVRYGWRRTNLGPYPIEVLIRPNRHEPRRLWVCIDDERVADRWVMRVDRLRSAAQAIDHLVALSFLPARFSSAYRAGFAHAATVAQQAIQEVSSYAI